MDHQDTLQLIAHCRADEAYSVEKLVRTHQDAVYRLALSILNEPAEADEAMQDAFIAVLGALDSPGIAEMLGIHETTVRSRLYTARERMRVVLKEHIVFEPEHKP